jgi:hypothetical protein
LLLSGNHVHHLLCAGFFHDPSSQFGALVISHTLHLRYVDQFPRVLLIRVWRLHGDQYLILLFMRSQHIFAHHGRPSAHSQ